MPKSVTTPTTGVVLSQPGQTIAMDPETQDGPLLVPVANPETVERLLDTAIDVARGQSMRIVVLHVVEVPPPAPPLRR